MTFSRWQNYLRISPDSFVFPLTSGVLLSLSFPPALCRWLIFIALVPLFLFLENASQKKSFWGSFLAGFLFLGWILQWLFASFPLSWVGIENPWAGISFIFLIWFLTATVLSIAIGFFGFFYKSFSKNLRPITTPALWISLEYIRAWLFSFFWAGPESLLGPHWTWGALGYTLTNFQPLLPFARIFGLYGAGFLLVAINVLSYSIIFRQKAFLKPFIFLGTALLFFFIFDRAFFGSAAVPIEKRRVALIQTSFAPTLVTSADEFAKDIAEESTLLKKAAEKNPDLVVLPEASRITLKYREETPRFLREIFGGDASRTIIDSSRVSEYEPSVERIYIYDPKEGLLATEDKRLLIPTGEYIPYVFSLPGRLLGFGDYLDSFDKGRALKKGGADPRMLFSEKTPREGALLCSAVASPLLWSEKAKTAEILINSASQSIFHGHPYFYLQIEAMLRFFAASNDRWLLQAANGGYNYIIDNQGIIREKSPEIGDGVLEGSVEYHKAPPHSTPPSDWAVFTSFIALIVLYLSTRMRGVGGV